MWKRLFEGYNLIDIVLLALLALVSFRFWARIRFWLPRYIHVIAFIGFVVALLALSAAPPDAPVNKHGAIGRVLIALALPAIVYLFFILHGGPRAAYRSSRGAAPCPFCKHPVRTLPEDVSGIKRSPQFAESGCPDCGRDLTLGGYGPS